MILCNSYVTKTHLGLEGTCDSLLVKLKPHMSNYTCSAEQWACGTMLRNWDLTSVTLIWVFVYMRLVGYCLTIVADGYKTTFSCRLISDVMWNIFQCDFVPFCAAYVEKPCNAQCVKLIAVKATGICILCVSIYILYIYIYIS